MKEAYIVEDLLPLSTLACILIQAADDEPDNKERDAIKKWLSEINIIIEGYLKDLDIKKIKKIKRRIFRLTNAIIDHFLANKFTVNKSCLILIMWINALIEAEGYILTEDKKKVLDQIISALEEGYNRVENYEKRIASAMKQVPKLHKLIQERGYYE